MNKRYAEVAALLAMSSVLEPLDMHGPAHRVPYSPRPTKKCNRKYRTPGVGNVKKRARKSR